MQQVQPPRKQLHGMPPLAPVRQQLRQQEHYQLLLSLLPLPLVLVLFHGSARLLLLLLPPPLLLLLM